jgi:hypothetical protein
MSSLPDWLDECMHAFAQSGGPVLNTALKTRDLMYLHTYFIVTAHSLKPLEKRKYSVLRFLFHS